MLASRAFEDQLADLRFRLLGPRSWPGLRAEHVRPGFPRAAYGRPGGDLGAGRAADPLEPCLADQVLAAALTLYGDRGPGLLDLRLLGGHLRAGGLRTTSSSVVCRDISGVTVFIWLVTSAGSCELSITERPIRAGSPLA